MIKILATTERLREREKERIVWTEGLSENFFPCSALPSHLGPTNKFLSYKKRDWLTQQSLKAGEACSPQTSEAIHPSLDVPSLPPSNPLDSLLFKTIPLNDLTLSPNSWGIFIISYMYVSKNVLYRRLIIWKHFYYIVDTYV